MKKGGKIHIFFPNRKKYAYFPPQLIENLQKGNKKGLKFSSCGAHHINIINFIWGKNPNQEGGGGEKMKFKLNKHPCSLVNDIFTQIHS